MKTRLLKELTLLQPALCVALLLAAVPPLLARLLFRPPVSSTVLLACFGLGVVTLAVSSLGREFNQRTFALLLSQPMARGRIWQEKVLILAVALAAVLGVFVVFQALSLKCFPGPDPGYGGYYSVDKPILKPVIGIVLLALAGGLWTAAFFRHAAAAFWFTVLTPFLVAVAARLAVERLLPVSTGDGLEATINGFVKVALGLYVVLGIVWSRRLFLRCEDVPRLVQEISFRWESAATVGVNQAQETRRIPWPSMALVKKELHLHQIVFLCAVFSAVVLIGLALITIWSGGKDSGYWKEILAFCFWIPCLLVPLLIGIAAIAEERRLGVVESQHCLPVSRKRQFILKWLVAYTVSVTLGSVFPWVLASTAKWLAGPSLPSSGAWDFGFLGFLFVYALAATTISFYASSLSRNTLQAMGIAVGLVALTPPLIVLVTNPGIFGSSPGRVAPFLPHGPLVLILGVPIAVLVLWRLSCTNSIRFHEGRPLWLRNLLVWAITLSGILMVTAAVYHRAWEILMPAEPPHGPGRLSGSERVKLCSDGAGNNIFALLPDGRLWISKHPRIWGLTANYAITFSPGGGTFVGSSNWTDLASSFNQLAGIQSDGSLWSFVPALQTNGDWNWQPRRIGSDSNWQSVTAGSDHLLALKQDGTLWGWGNNGYHQLGISGKRRSDEPVRVGADSDWIRVYATGEQSLGLKREGSAWGWGYWMIRTNGVPRYQAVAEPTRLSNAFAVPWRSIGSYGPCKFAVHPDGSLWAWGSLPPEFHRPAPEPVRYGADSDWKAVDSGWLLKNDGTLWTMNSWASAYPNGQPAPEKRSQHADWVALTTGEGAAFVLAADGTIYCWGKPRDYARSSLLAPTRKPWRLANVFEGAR